MSKSVYKGIRVLDMGHIIAGPIAASVLADFGAEVIKIERPGTGDSLRKLHRKDGVGLQFKVTSRNKKSITLDLKKKEGRDIFLRLVETADVLVENYRPGVMEKLDLSWETLKAVNSKLILCRVSGFGQTGPLSPRRGFGKIAEAFGGFTYITGEADGPPLHSQLSLGDVAAGMWAAVGIINALYWRDAQGGGLGQVIDIGLYEGIFRLIEQQVIVADQLNENVVRAGNYHNDNPFAGAYLSKDGGYFSVSVGTMKAGLDVLRAMGIEGDDRFNDWDRLKKNVAAYRATASAWMADHTLDEIEAAFQKYSAPGTRVMSASDLIKHPHVLARDMVVAVKDAELGEVRMQGIVPKMSATPGQIDHAGQALGESNELIYGGILGMSKAEIESLRSRGVI